MNIATIPNLVTSAGSWTDSEQAMASDVVRSTNKMGVRANPLSILNFYVAVKSRYPVLLAGPAQTGKIALVQSLARVLSGDPAWQCQLIVGHPRWASQSQDVSFFVEAQARFNRSKLLALIEEAMLPGNADRLFIACLARISPAELDGYFSLSGLQFWPNQASESVGSPNVEPIPYPQNIRLVGTMDTPQFMWWDTELLMRTAILQWQAAKLLAPENMVGLPMFPGREKAFLQTAVFTKQAAYARLQHVLEGKRQAFQPLVKVVDVLNQHAVSVPLMVMNQAIIYLANAWTADAGGIFDCSPQINLHRAIDLAMAQFVLPWAIVTRQESQGLQQCLLEVLDGRFRNATAFVRAMRTGTKTNHKTAPQAL